MGAAGVTFETGVAVGVAELNFVGMRSLWPTLMKLLSLILLKLMSAVSVTPQRLAILLSVSPFLAIILAGQVVARVELACAVIVCEIISIPTIITTTNHEKRRSRVDFIGVLLFHEQSLKKIDWERV